MIGDESSDASWAIASSKALTPREFRVSDLLVALEEQKQTDGRLPR